MAGRRTAIAFLAGAALAPLARLACANPAEEADPEADRVAYFRAVRIDDERTVQAVLARGLDPNLHEPERGETGLIIALRHDAMRVARLLLAQPGVKVDQPAPNGNTALMMAALQKNMPAVLALLEKGAQINRPGWTALHYAAAAGDLDIMKLLLERHAYIDAASPTGTTPLMLAAREGQEDAVQLLLEAGADAALKDRAWRENAAESAMRAQKPWIAERIRSHLSRK
ncbi:ankyrin repeat domain-containing protein [Pseudoduganella sp. HUAS MS19]